jgi:hypothetical protein
VTPTATPEPPGCTPGFWQGGTGLPLWNQTPQDPQWVAAHFVNAQPYRTGTLFNSFFTTYGPLNGKSMLYLVGQAGGSSPAVKAARDVVAAYLNASRFGDPAQVTNSYPVSRADVAQLWTDAVNGCITFEYVHEILGPLNEGSCPTP